MDKTSADVMNGWVFHTWAWVSENQNQGGWDFGISFVQLNGGFGCPGGCGEVNGVGVEIMPISGDACFSRAVYETFYLFHPEILWLSEERQPGGV